MKTILFDMGGVITGILINEYTLNWCNGDKELSAWIMKNVIHTVESIKLDRGTMTDAEAIESICQKTPSKYHTIVADYLNEFRRKLDPNTEMYNFIKELKERGHKIYLFSNVGYRYHEMFKYMPSMELMDGLWCSCDYKVIKPEIAAYESICDKFSLNPADCIFIDDKPENIEQAMNYGMQGIVYQNSVSELREKLYHIL